MTSSLPTESMAEATFSKEPSRLGAGWWWRRVLQLRGSWSPRLSHGVGAMHVDGFGRAVRALAVALALNNGKRLMGVLINVG